MSTKTDFISLYHPTGELYLTTTYENGMFSYEAEFKGIDVETELIPLIAHSLTIKNRFCGQSRIPFSVLRHSLYVGICLHTRSQGNPGKVFEGLMHDSGEAFFADVPAPFKNDEDRKREHAIVDAMPWDILHSDSPADPDIKHWDTIALVCESMRYGHPDWPWPSRLRESFGGSTQDLDLYFSTMDIYDKVDDEHIKHIWEGMVNNAQHSI